MTRPLTHADLFAIAANCATAYGVPIDELGLDVPRPDGQISNGGRAASLVFGDRSIATVREDTGQWFTVALPPLRGSR